MAIKLFNKSAVVLGGLTMFTFYVICFYVDSLSTHLNSLPARMVIFTSKIMLASNLSKDVVESKTTNETFNQLQDSESTESSSPKETSSVTKGMEPEVNLPATDSNGSNVVSENQASSSTTTTTSTAASDSIAGEARVEASAEAPSTWISISVCWSANTKFYGKGKFPYVYATTLSTKLWTLKTSHKVMISVVFHEQDRGSQELLNYEKELREIAQIVTLVPSGTMDCPLKSQMQRLFGFLEADVKDEDYIISSDVDAFVMDPNIFSNLKENFSVWVYQYSEVQSSQGTMPICFIAMNKTLWRQLLSVDSPEKLLAKYNSTFDIGAQVGWDYDQMIISRILLEAGLCTAPPGNGLWNTVRLKPPSPPVNDSDTCFHGLSWRNCYSGSSGAMYQFDGCKWWHFTPDSSKEHLQERYDIIASQQEFG